VEMRFAHLKTHHGFERLRLRGLSGARDEFHLAAIVQTSRRWRSGSSDRRLRPPARELRRVSLVASALRPTRHWARPEPQPISCSSIYRSTKPRRSRRRLFRQHRSSFPGPTGDWARSKWPL
jgi:hypothetical protein